MDALPAEQDGERHVAAAGRLVLDKGFDLLIAAFAEIAEPFPDVMLDIAGDGPQRLNLENLATSLGIADRVRFHGWLDTQPRLGQAAWTEARYGLEHRAEAVERVREQVNALRRAG